MRCNNRCSYSMTSSQSCRNDSRGDRPSAFAVFRLTVRSYLMGRLHWQITRLLALENAMHILTCAPADVAGIGSIGHQTSLSDELSIGGNGRHPVLIRQPNDLLAHVNEENVRSQN